MIAIETMQTAVSDENGLVSFGSVPSGSYLLVETVSPSGYSLPKGQWLVEINADKEEVTFTALEDHAAVPAVLTGQVDDLEVFLLTNRQSYGLPMMGGNGILRFILVGLAILLAGLAALGIKKARSVTHTDRPPENKLIDTEKQDRKSPPPARGIYISMNCKSPERNDDNYEYVDKIWGNDACGCRQYLHGSIRGGCTDH